MRRAPPAAPSPAPVFRIGATYRLKAGEALVTAEDHEILSGRRTGRILVRAVDVGGLMPVRWYSEPSELEEVDETVAVLWHGEGARP